MSEIPQNFEEQDKQIPTESAEPPESFQESWQAVVGNQELPPTITEKAKDEYRILSPLRVVAGIMTLTALVGLGGAFGGPRNAEAFPQSHKMYSGENEWEQISKNDRRLDLIGKNFMVELHNLRSDDPQLKEKVRRLVGKNVSEVLQKPASELRIKDYTEVMNDVLLHKSGVIKGLTTNAKEKILLEILEELEKTNPR